MQHLLRNKIVYIAFVIFTLPQAGYCQLRDAHALNNPNFDDYGHHFGIHVGMNKSHFNFLHHPYYLQQDSVNTIESINSTGINLSLLAEFRISDHFAFRTTPGLIFSEKVFEYNLKFLDFQETNPVQKKVQSITATLPFYLKFSSDRIQNFKVYTITGFKIENDLAANAGATKAENLIKLKKLDYAIEAGIGFHFYFPVFVLTPEIKVSWGLANLHSRDVNLKFSNVIDKINSRMITFSLTVE
jgi:Outer membrane protein beta-barrel domain